MTIAIKKISKSKGYLEIVFRTMHNIYDASDFILLKYWMILEI